VPVTLTPENVEPTYDNSEIGCVTTVGGDSLAILRGQEGTIAKPVTVGWVIRATLTRRSLEKLEAAIADVDASTHTHGNSAVLDATTAAFTTTDETKLEGIAPGATVNDSDANSGLGPTTPAHRPPRPSRTSPLLLTHG
jgi:hypothetical protein